jgi:cysteine desulfurase
MSDPVKKTIYLDCAATTPLDPAVYEAMLPHLRENYGNPSSIHHIGRAAFDALHGARHSLATSLAVDAREIILTGSGTESDNLALLGLARAQRHQGNHLIVSAIEHKAVLEAARVLETEGFRVTYLPVDAYGVVSLTELEKSLCDETILVSIMYANNEIGTTEPIKEIADRLAIHYHGKQKPLFHTDACQAVGFLPVSPRELGVDALTINSSKIYGPKGIGLLYLKDGLTLSPVIVGGHQENGRRAGTENVALAVGFATALTHAVSETAATAGRLTLLRDHFLNELQRYVPTLILNGHPTKRLPNNIHLCIPAVEGEALLLMLDAAGIYAATGSACNAADLEPSHVLTAIGRDENLIHGSLRFTFGKYTTALELTDTAKVLGAVVERLSALSATPFLNTRPYVTHS